MGNVTIQKRGKYYQYKFEVAKVDGKRKFINKSGFDTKDEAIKAGNIAYTEYLNTGLVFKEKEIEINPKVLKWFYQQIIQRKEDLYGKHYTADSN